MTALFVKAATGFVEVIAVSEDEHKLQEKAMEYFDERNIEPEYYHGDYMFTLNGINAWLCFQEVEVLL